jgi:hypothetical protein
MKHMSLERAREKSSIAWFKLAEVITRGEKERALSIYRLLMHSVPHEAVKAQLEGDILDVFNDPAALHAYSRAAELYQSNNEEMQASLLYERIVALLLAQREHAQAYKLIKQSKLHDIYKTARYEQLVVGMLTSHTEYDKNVIEQVIVAILQGYQFAAEYRDKRSLFFAKLAALDEKVHAYACEQALIV